RRTSIERGTAANRNGVLMSGSARSGSFTLLLLLCSSVLGCAAPGRDSLLHAASASRSLREPAAPVVRGAAADASSPEPELPTLATALVAQNEHAAVRDPDPIPGEGSAPASQDQISWQED